MTPSANARGLSGAEPTQVSAQREKVHFLSGDAECAAWYYPGTNGACVIMAGGTAVTKEPGTDRFAKRFHEAGFTVLAFDFRRLGESGGRPRQIVRVGKGAVMVAATTVAVTALLAVLLFVAVLALIF